MTTVRRNGFGVYYAWLAPAALFLLTGADKPMSPEQIEAAAAGSPEARAAAAEGTNCENEPKLRSRAFCYLKSDSESSIDPLFATGRAILEKDKKYPMSAWQDFTYAAENAGVLAAKSHDTRVHAGLRSADEADHIFAVRALGHMLAIERMGYGQGGAADAANRKVRLGPAHRACLATLSSPNEQLLRAGGDCVKEIGDASDAPALTNAVIGHAQAPKLQAYLVEILSGLRPITEASLRKLAPILEQPLASNWSHDELYMRGHICTMIVNQLPSPPAWAHTAAATAVREIGNRNGQARQPCERLAPAAAK